MPEDERARMSALRNRVRANDVHSGVRKFLSAAGAASERGRAAAQSPADVVQCALAGWLAQRPSVALFLDYDGTLTPMSEKPELATLSETARQTLEEAASTPNLDIVIVSGRSLIDLQTMVDLPGLTYVGNHGFEIEGPGITYRHDGGDRYHGALERAANELAELGIEGAWVERKGATLSYHVRAVSDDRLTDARRRALAMLRRRGLRAILGHGVVEGRPPVDWHKGQAVLHILRQRHGSDWPSRVRALFIGDDVTDEDAFRSLHGIGRSICVGPSTRDDTTADFQVPDPTAVLNLLRWLASGGFLTAR
ncbi:MAG: trehalose-phosphatase [Gemmatimonadetes bacterium]|nr:trehalose-phosphatase [Gemmatimonadota bacterium]